MGIVMTKSTDERYECKSLNYRGAECLERDTFGSGAEYGRRLPCLGNYHRLLQCLVAIELKAVEFEPEFAGKMNFYLNLLDANVRLPNENPSIGIILCKSKKRTKVEFALRGIEKPMGVAEYYLTQKLPKALQGKLPTAKQIEAELKKREQRGSRETL